MARGGDSFLGSKGSGPVSNLYNPSQDRWSDRILYAINSMLGIDVPEKLRLSVFVQSYALGKPSDEAVDLTMPAKDWGLIGFLKAFAPLTLSYKAELVLVNTALTSLSGKVDALNLKIDALNVTATAINTGVTGIISEVQDVDSGVVALNATARSEERRVGKECCR